YHTGMARLNSELELLCPCCGATLVFDRNLERIVEHRAPERADKPELDKAQRILAEEAARREAIFEQSMQAEKSRGDALSKRFEEALRQARQEPITRPPRRSRERQPFSPPELVRKGHPAIATLVVHRLDAVRLPERDVARAQPGN